MVCTLEKTANKELRLVYEAFIGDRIGDTAWRSVKTFMVATGLAIDSNNLHEYAALRKRYPKISLSPLEFKALLEALDKAKNSLPKWISGEEFIRLLIAQGIRPDISTIYRWFSQSGSRYNKSTNYSVEIMYSVIYRAVVWKFIDVRKQKKNG